MCRHRRKLNTMTVKTSYPLPWMDKFIDTFRDAPIVTTLNSFKVNWQIDVPKDCPKKSFVCHVGQLQYMRMPFSITDFPATFQPTLDVKRSRFKWKNSLFYIFYIIVFSKPMKEQIQHIDEILTALDDSGVILNIKKFKFVRDKVRYLGHVIKPAMLEIDSANTK